MRFEIPFHRVEALTAAPPRLASKAAKLAVEAISFSVSEKPVRRKTFEVSDRETFETGKVILPVHSVEVSGPAPVLGGWSLISVLDHGQGETTVRRVGGPGLGVRAASARHLEQLFPAHRAPRVVPY